VELPKPEIALDQASKVLIDDAVQLAKKVNEFRPLSGELLEKVQRALLGERVYNSNAIEGSTLTLRETRLVLETGADIDVGRKREAQEALNLAKAFQRVQELLDESSVGEPHFLDIHRQLFSNINEGIGGVYRNQDVVIWGAKHQPPDASRVADLMEDFFSYLRDQRMTTESAIQLATWTHWCIARIHPFLDGNGRMARLWQDLVLFNGKLTAAVIPQQERSRYYECLSSADDGDFNALAQLIAQSVTSTLQLYINAFSEADSIRDWATEIVEESDARTHEQRTIEYTRWRFRMEELRDAFERCAAQLTNASAGDIEIELRPFTIVDQATWDSLRSGEGASKTWFFWLNCRRGPKRLAYCFFFGRHWWSPLEQSFGNIPPSACLLVSESEGRGDPTLLNTIEGSPISIREILVLDNRLACKKLDNVGQVVLQRNVDAVNIAQSFLQDVLLKRMG
jgi:Fic family protein